MSRAMVPLHPQPTGRPDELRWIVPAGTLTGTGALARVPAAPAALLADGTLAAISLEATAVVTRLGPGRTWAEDGPRVRTALHTALEDPAGWIVDAGAGPGADDAALYGVVVEVLAGETGDFVRSHGGGIDLVDVTDGVVTVCLRGACHGCPASWLTLHQRLERRIRQRHPALREVRDIAAPPGSPLRPGRSSRTRNG
ncbi:NifU family protein [Streptomyces sp. SLBN-31]|uniref:NifU family protein n=1 Tax=Streptomyces sp. SLBN-31 TaxID=2768444 RepID=UPI001C92CC3A|nr:NifU family protein [Streptomyces sp. SLBN-31]